VRGSVSAGQAVPASTATAALAAAGGWPRRPEQARDPTIHRSLTARGGLLVGWLSWQVGARRAHHRARAAAHRGLEAAQWRSIGAKGRTTDCGRVLLLRLTQAW
jgi:hypothetical protein